MRCLSAPFSVMTRYGITGKFTFDVAELPIRLRRARISASGGLECLLEHDESYIYQAHDPCHGRPARPQPVPGATARPSPALLQAA
jgi:hypothetical protein